jgi:predicted  nucleic acid-binding Zn-ribbon protein
MADERELKDLHKRLEVLERRIAAARGELAEMSDQRRMSLEAALESVSAAFDHSGEDAENE